jgi:hypothetical protein
MKTSLRILNKKSSILGLSVEDLILLATVHFFIQSIFAMLKFEVDFYILLFSVSAFVALSIIRLKVRRHIIRDFIKYGFFNLIRGGLAYDPSTYRYRKQK